MTFSGYRIKVPGKLLVTGEYAVLEPNQQAIVIAINRYITANIEPSHYNQLSIPQLGFDGIKWRLGLETINFTIVEPRLKFVQNAILIATQYLKEKSIKLQPFHLSIKSELVDEKTGRKYGLGSSGAIVVAVISAILTLHETAGNHSTTEQIFKLSAIAHLKSQKGGSGIDIAASTFGGWICYSSYNGDWVLNQLNKKVKLIELISKKWPNLVITPLNPLPQIKLCVGWTTEEVSTQPMINEIKKLRSSNKIGYEHFLDESSSSVTRLINSFENNDYNEAILSLKQNREALKNLCSYAGARIETSKLKRLCDLAEKYGSGKSSGAGGGDCGIAFVRDESQVEKLYEDWTREGILPLNLSVSPMGAIVTEYNCEMSLKEYLLSV